MVTFKIILLILAVLLLSAFFVIGIFMGRIKGGSNNKNFRVLFRIRMGCFLAMLISLFLIVVIR